MILYRLVRKAYANDLSGTGARLYGGRWHSKGKATIYMGSSEALALLEVLVHLPSIIIPKDYYSIKIEVPDSDMAQIKIKDLPSNWNDMTPPESLKKIGDDFLNKKEHLLLKVPSAIVPNENNYLLNLEHPLMKDVKIIKAEAFYFDKRLFNN